MSSRGRTVIQFHYLLLGLDVQSRIRHTLHVLIFSAIKVIACRCQPLAAELPLSDIMHLPFLLATGSWLIFVERTWTALVDVTIDDTYGDPNTGAQIMYMPDNWNNGTSCSACTAHPASSQTYLGTWHDNTWNPPANSTEAAEVQTASAAFNGSAVYIFCIIAHSLVSPDGNTNMTFYIDDETVGHYALLPSGAQPTYSYNINVYLNTSVPPGQHTIKIQNGPLGQKALVLLDYITYS
ncbi:hypothetical protein PILCRDRAFT_391863 [Piloderma croceum F 1598]|uniref:Uncharacterized protein n=1 Tax=Piloderma croceum (strain F 1598) TaxID=765440 RepID=A0A0C3G253_PILCF|nr:hypothetical protein PILCRDRAFT_391863 [Piloderma croceum F 1598]